MNWDQIEGKWEQLKGDVKTTWAKLTDEDLRYVSGQRERLAGKLHERYGLVKEQAQKDIDEWVKKIGEKIERAGRDIRSH